MFHVIEADQAKFAGGDFSSTPLVSNLTSFALSKLSQYSLCNIFGFLE
jgi:hypothetical protein